MLLPIAGKWHHVLEEELCVTRDLRRNVCMLILLLLLMCKMWWRAWTYDKTPFLGLGFEIRARNKWGTNCKLMRSSARTFAPTRCPDLVCLTRLSLEPANQGPGDCASDFSLIDRLQLSNVSPSTKQPTFTLLRALPCPLVTQPSESTLTLISSYHRD